MACLAHLQTGHWLTHLHLADAMSRRALPVINPDRCTGCGRCVAACPPHVLWLATARADGFGDKQAVLHDPDGCTGCALCIAPCPFDAIAMQRKPGAHGA
ncbi:MAG: ferredoxin family protein [Moraxellaceae bacterium]|nr:ferredoxin family protein [Moraxellaceae bacterium]